MGGHTGAWWEGRSGDFDFEFTFDCFGDLVLSSDMIVVLLLP